MASNVTTSASFTTSNMKPAANDQADALWAQNIADNTGYVFYRKTPGPSFSSVISYGNCPPAEGTHWFNHRTEWPYLVGSYAIRGTCSGAVTFNVHGTILVNGVLVIGTSFTVSASGNTLVTGSFVVDKSAFTTNTDYAVAYKHYHDEGNSATPLLTNMDITTWQSATNP